MSKKIRIVFNQPPEGLTQVINEAGPVCEAAAQKIAARAESLSETGTKYRVYLRKIAFGQDNIYHVSRPAAVIDSTNEDTYIDEALNKTLARAVGKL